MRKILLTIILIFSALNCFAQNDETKDLTETEFFLSQIDFDSTIKEEKIERFEKITRATEISKLVENNHSSKVIRDASTESQKLLIKKAEALLPKILDMSWRTSVTLKADLEKPRSATDFDNEEEPFWSFNSFDGIKIPRILSTRAVNYYQRVSLAFRNKQKVTQIKMLSSDLNYVANVRHYKEYEIKNRQFQNVNVVSLKLEWYQYCGILCAMGFTRQKLVIFNENAEPIVMFVDSDNSYWVS